MRLSKSIERWLLSILVTTGAAVFSAAAYAADDVDLRFPFPISVARGASCFQGGDQVLITGVHGTAKDLGPGNLYQIKGEYRLVSAPEATLTAAVIASNGNSPITSTQQSATLQKGVGEFTLVLPYTGEGRPRITLNGDNSSSGALGFVELVPGNFPYVVSFDQSDWQMKVGDDLAITEIRSSTPSAAPGATLQISGTYALGSQGAARLAVIGNETNGGFPGGSAQPLEMTQGAGYFTLIAPASRSPGVQVGMLPTGSATAAMGSVTVKLGKPRLSPATRPVPLPVVSDLEGVGNGLLFNYSLYGGSSSSGGSTVVENSFVPGQFPFKVNFKTGLTQFAGGDSIAITEVRGNSKVIQLGGYYNIKGTYTLSSCSEALLATYVTLGGKQHFSSGGEIPQQSIHVFAGGGTFSLILPVQDRGWPHLAFYPKGAKSDSGTRYFGTGDTVLYHWNQPLPAN